MPKALVYAVVCSLAAASSAIAQPEGNLDFSAATFVPFYMDTPAGEVTLFAFHYRGVFGGDVELEFITNDGNSMTAIREVEQDGTVTINVRDLELPVDPDLGGPAGMVFLRALDSDEQVLAGDWFFVDPVNDFAISGRMPTTIPNLCGAMRLRYAKGGGGVFDGTDVFISFPFLADHGGGPGEPITVARIIAFDEQGVLAGPQLIVSSEKVVTRISTQELETMALAKGYSLPTFGVLQISFGAAQSSAEGYVVGAMRAEGRFSVSVEPFCHDV